MVNSRLHVICGNCGSLNDMKWHYEPEGFNVTDEDDGEEEVLHAKV